MATKKKKKAAKAKKPPVPKRITDEEFLETLIRVSEANVTNQGTSIDELFAAQAARLRKELEELRSKK